MLGAGAAAVVVAAAVWLATSREEPLRIGFSIAQTGALSGNGKPGLLALQIWKDDVNGRGGLLGRKVELVFQDDQSDPATVPGIYGKLLDTDKVDLVISPVGTDLIAALMPLAIERKLTVFGLFGLGNNEEYRYPNYFQILPSGPNPRARNATGFFELASRQLPRPQTVALVGADDSYGRYETAAARTLIKKLGFTTVYDRAYSPRTVDFGSVVRAIKKTNADLVYVASYPPDSVAILRAAHEEGLEPAMVGGGMVGPQFASVMTELGPLLNGVVNFSAWVPAPALLAMPGIQAFIKEYDARATATGVDPLGYHLPPYAYALGQIIEKAVETTGSVDQQKIADIVRATSFETIVGPVKFGKNGEWAKGRILTVQYQNVQGHGVDQFRGPEKYVVLWPEDLASGNIIYPYSKAQK
ncbi:MAG: branched-chain amino acid ABC transporter substrate-binding protein [Thermoleophilia bacterium]|nr:branched-chain amino acid ABC transporter substrate-binding protein [Thermoleophilia bacterium]